LGAVENSIKVLNRAFTYFVRNFKNNFQVVDYFSTIETANNCLPHIHFLVQLEKPIAVCMTHSHKGDYFLPSYEVKSKINKLWIKAIKIASEKLFIENKRPVKVFVNGVYDSHIIDYMTKQWIPINKLVLKDSILLTSIERATIFTHYFCKIYSIRQVRNSDNIDKIKLENDSSQSDLLLVFHDKYLNKNTHYFIKMFLTLDFYKTRGLSLEDFPVSIFKFSLKTPRKPLLKPQNVLKSLVSQYSHAFNLIIENGIKNDYWFKKVYTIEDLLNISFDGDFYFILENE
jgi:hypothetical protein